MLTPSTAVHLPDRRPVFGVARPAGRIFPERRGTLDPVEHRYLGDLLEAAGGRGAVGRAEAPSNENTYARMTAELLDTLAEPLSPVNRMVLAYALPDPAIKELAGCSIADLCSGDPVVFSVSGQGAGAPFTALRILSATHDESALNGGACLIFDQRPGPLTDLLPGAAAGADSAVLLHTASGGRPTPFLWDEEAADPSAALAEVAALFPADHLVLGPELAAATGPVREGPGEVRPAPASLPCTGLWHVAASLWDHPGPLLLAEIDPVAGRLHAVGFGPGDGPDR
ncbi:hypothetical protein MHW47_13875 [Streptomyces sp. OfavH-34-F]|uniref:hypothetical protein n=1 Tax=Streptomyces sp. OfavH-34-F TaxID=2917760 RepID=UPI001EF25A30|nr:hypothetical protein [Streptomyces sp. OfavH-34-F]MCG7525530.1 hypothetical protein [Streptomyces sp. OfavH-34-F]